MLSRIRFVYWIFEHSFSVLLPSIELKYFKKNCTYFSLNKMGLYSLVVQSVHYTQFWRFQLRAQIVDLTKKKQFAGEKLLQLNFFEKLPECIRKCHYSVANKLQLIFKCGRIFFQFFLGCACPGVFLVVWCERTVWVSASKMIFPKFYGKRHTF